MLRFPERIVTKRTLLRRIAFNDALGWKNFNNAIHKRMPSWPIVPSVVYARNEIIHYDRMWEKGTQFVYVILDRKTGKVIGDFHLKDPKNGRVEFGHALHPVMWSTGITYETLDAAREAATALGLKMWCRVEEENIRSWKSLEKYHATFKGTRTLQGKSMRMYEL